MLESVSLGGRLEVLKTHAIFELALCFVLLTSSVWAGTKTNMQFWKRSVYHGNTLSGLRTFFRQEVGLLGFPPRPPLPF